MLMVITGGDDATADLVIQRLAEMQCPCIRLNTETFPVSTNVTVDYRSDPISGWIVAAGRKVCLDEIDTIWFRKPRAPEISSTVTNPQAKEFAAQECKSLLTGVYRLLGDRFWVSHPDAIRPANDKIEQLSVARRMGFRVPQTCVTNDPSEALEFCLSTKAPKVIKPLKAGNIEYPDGRVELIYTSILTADDVENIHQVAYAPCLLQEYVPKRYEVRITVIGRTAIAAGLDSQASEVSRHDWRRHNCSSVRYFPTSIPEELNTKLCAFMDFYRLEFSAFDFVLTPDGEYVFLENNPNGQWAWLDLALGNGLVDRMATFLKTGGRSERRR